ncbi:MAG: hypothetical protein LC799_02650, partial [Actinobacteria bacterium]|nr:hypothetical protein [Actinomycetota bacterium]
LMVDYPARVRCAPELTRLADGRDWLEAADTALSVIRPPSARELDDLNSAVSGLRTSTSRYRRQGTNHEQLDRLVADIRAAAEAVARLTRCPICGGRGNGPERRLTRRAEETFRCTCPCGSAWETRRCRSCGKKYPVLTIPELTDEVGGDGDHLDRVFGQDLLAMPCWMKAGAFVCTRCGHCPEAETAHSHGCTRCTSGATPAPINQPG